MGALGALMLMGVARKVMLGKTGRFERANQTAGLLDTKYPLLSNGGGRVSAGNIVQLHALLRSASGYHAFRRIYSSHLTPARIAGFLLFDCSQGTYRTEEAAEASPPDRRCYAVVIALRKKAAAV